MVTVAEVYAAVDALAPFASQAPWDNSGLLVGDFSARVEKVLVALDATLPVVEQAAALGATLILTHHPVIFHPVKAFLAGNPPYEAARRGIAILSAHTNYDMAPLGVNHALAELLGLLDCAPLAVEKESPLPNTTLGLVGTLPAPLFPPELLALVENRLGLAPRALPWAGPIRRVAVCGGAGADLWEQAAALGAQAFLTGDVRHHEFLAAAAGGVFLVDGGHAATEAPAMPQLSRQLRAAFPGLEVLDFSGIGERDTKQIV